MGEQHITISPEEIKRIVKESVNQAMDDRASSKHPCVLSDEDIVFVRGFRKKFNMVANTIGVSVILAFMGGVYFIIDLGLTAWRGK